ncbi:unnamed protein product [Gongylonema pulchrum]|uniref:RIC3 domain-containing protein n=1 Tax=Gongylonema pulchrum TaxID=637853 RepID=A0A183DUV5_9BILA|nr:unnamed protein product [Gongylonema pulchrum]
MDLFDPVYPSFFSRIDSTAYCRPYGAAGTGPIFRNLPLFGFLAGLVLFFFFFYVYQAQSAELNLVRDQAEFEKAQYSKIKADNIDCSTELRKANDQLQAYVPETERLRKEKM